MPNGKKERLIQFNRSNILEAAEGLFARKGIAATTMDDISKAADTSKSTIYVYFKSKEEIYEHIIHSHMLQLLEAAQALVRSDQPFQACYFSLCRQLTEAYERYPLYFSSMLGHIAVDEKSLAESSIRRSIYAVGEELNESMLALFRRGAEEGVLRPGVDLLASVYTLWAALSSIIVMAHEKESYLARRMGMDRAAFLDHAFRLLLTAVQIERSEPLA